jgi:hypothetical protein
MPPHTNWRLFRGAYPHSQHDDFEFPANRRSLYAAFDLRIRQRVPRGAAGKGNLTPLFDSGTRHFAIAHCRAERGTGGRE